MTGVVGNTSGRAGFSAISSFGTFFGLCTPDAFDYLPPAEYQRAGQGGTQRREGQGN
jgi:hypothetical protein